MARPDRFDEYEEEYERHPPPRRGANPALVVALIFGGVILFAFLGCVGLGSLGWLVTPQPPAAGPPVVVQGEEPVAAPGNGKGGMRRVYTRDEFRRLVIGKTPDEVTAAVGEPDETLQDGGVARWTYRDRVTTGPGKGAATPVVIFQDGRVAEVTY